MKDAQRNVELILITALITTTLIFFFLISVSSTLNTPQTILTNLSLLMIFGSSLLTSILLLKVHGKLGEMIEILRKNEDIL